jgi:hypothetical protein
MQAKEPTSLSDREVSYRRGAVDNVVFLLRLNRRNKRITT